MKHSPRIHLILLWLGLNSLPLTHLNFFNVLHLYPVVAELAVLAPPRNWLLSGKSHGQRSRVGCSPRGRWKSDTTERLHFHFSLSCIGEGNGNPLQCSCLENPRDRRAWWVAIYGVAQSRTRLSDLAAGTDWASQVAHVAKNLLAQVGDFRAEGLVLGLGRSPGGGHGNPLQDSCLENTMDRGAWRAAVHEVTVSQKQLKWVSTRTRNWLETHSQPQIYWIRSIIGGPQKIIFTSSPHDSGAL